MNQNPVSLTAALADAWERMKTILFRPFELSKWMVIGFTAWLAGLGGGGNFNLNFGDWGDSTDAEQLDRAGTGLDPIFRLSTWKTWWQWLLDHPIWLAAGTLGCGLLIALVLTLLWVKSRGKFMFLDNVLRNRAAVVSPWKRYRRAGNSHFGFQLMFSVAVIGTFVGLALAFIGLNRGGANLALDTTAARVGLAVAVVGLLLVALVLGYIQYFLDGFVVPLMYRYDLRVMPAWSRFGRLFRARPWPFLLSGPFVLLLGIGVVLAIVVAGLLTCCIGFLLIIIPYIGTVVTLPVPVTYRAFTVALLDQIDPGFFDQERATPSTATPPPAPAPIP